MGQKTHPNGLRVGLYRKWVSSWYGSRNEQNSFNPSIKKNFISPQGVISARGGVFFSNIDDFIENLFKRYFMTKISFSRRLMLVDFRFFKGRGGQTYGFLFYTKLIMRQKALSIFQQYMTNIYYFNINTVNPIIQKRRFFKKEEGIFSFSEYKFIQTFKKDYNISLVRVSKSIRVFKKQFDSFAIKYQFTNEFYLQKFSNFFRYSIVSYAYFCSSIFQKNFLVFFTSYNFFFAKQKITSQIFSVVTKQNRFLFLRILNRFEQTTLFVDNIYASSIVFFSKIFNTNNKFNKFIKINSYKRFSFATKRYLARFAGVKGIKAKKSALALFVSSGSVSNTGSSLFKHLSKFYSKSVSASNNKVFLSYTIPFFTSRTYFRQKVITKKKRRSIKSKLKNKFNFKSKDKVSYNGIRYSSEVRKGYKEVQPESFYFKLYSTSYQESKSNTNNFSQLKLLLGLITNTRFSFYFMNALSLSRFAFDKEYYRLKDKQTQQYLITNAFSQKKGKRCSQRFLRNIEQEIIWRFRYVAIYIKDLIRIVFLSIYLKKATFRVSFFSYILAKLPRNRKETQFLRFLMQLVKIFSTHRRERLGLRIRFQGRVNRWRRTKHRVGVKGSVSYSSYNSRIVYGMAQAITRKGAQGIRLWLCYQSTFGKKLRDSIYRYAALPKKIYIKKNTNSYKVKSKIVNKFNSKLKRKLKKMKINKIFSKYKAIMVNKNSSIV